MTTSVRPVLLAADRCSVSGLLAMSPEPARGTIVALHGGGMNATYFHGSATPELSLLTIGAAVGWNVLALDRPGYRAAAGLASKDGRLVAQTEIVYSALDGFAASHDIGAGFFLLGHSYGLKLAIHLAAHDRGTDFLGLDGSGAGRRYRPERSGKVTASTSRLSKDDAIRLFWGARELYPPGTFPIRRGLVEPVPEAENLEAPTWVEVFPSLAPQVRIPVRITMAEYENWWVSDDEELAEIARAFSSAPVVEIVRQPDAGHNISLGLAARPYHLAGLAFAERCLLHARRRRGDKRFDGRVPLGERHRQRRAGVSPSHRAVWPDRRQNDREERS